MARYRPVDVRLWSDRRFLSLSDDGRLLWLLLLTTPSMLSIPGVIVGGEGTLSEQIGWTVERYRSTLFELETKGMKVIVSGRLLYLSNALKYQKIGGSKTIKGMAKVWDEIQDCELKSRIYEDLKIACKSWSGVFNKSIPKPLGMPHTQTSMEGLDTRSGSGSGTISGSGTGTRERDETRPHLSLVIPDPEIEKRRRLGNAAWDRMNALRRSLASEWGLPEPEVFHEQIAGGVPRNELADRLREAGDRAEAQLEKVFTAVEREAVAKHELTWIRPSMFSANSWMAKLADDRGRPRQSGSRVGQIDAIFDDMAKVTT